jgi:hypothetical protein
MFLVLLDTPCLLVFDSTTEAIASIEPFDAESEIRAAFDDDAVPYRVEWIQPNRRRGWWLFGSVSPGVYRFVPAGPPDRAAFIALLENHRDCTDPPEARKTMTQLLERMRST